jgi:hypothetical protein
VRIAVTHRFGGKPDSSPQPFSGAGADVGIGLLIVKAIARRWGTERVNGQRVWAVVGA